MQKHTKVYLEYYQTYPEMLRCEVCGNDAIDIHHIQARSSFGKKTKHLQDNITNLIALDRECHQKAHLQIEPYLYRDELQRIHDSNLI